MPAPASPPPTPDDARMRRLRLLVVATGLSAVLAAPTVALAARRAVKGGHGALQRAVVRRINAARAVHRLPPVRLQRRLARAASAQSADQLRSGRLSHDSADATPFGRRVRRYSSARWTGETIAWLTARQPITATTIVRAWMASPPHRHLLMDRRFRRIGVGACSGRVGGHATTVVTADFASGR